MGSDVRAPRFGSLGVPAGCRATRVASVPAGRQARVRRLMRGSGVRHDPWLAWPARWLATRSLRGQLITGLVALLALACACVGVVTYLVLSHTLLNQLDNQLQAAGGRYASCMEEKHHEGPPLPPGVTVTNCGKTPGLSAGTFGARVKNGSVTDQGIIGGQSHLSAADEVTLTRLPPNGRFYTKDLTSLHGDYRLTAIKGEDGDVLITGLPLSGMESTPAQGGDR